MEPGRRDFPRPLVVTRVAALIVCVVCTQCSKSPTDPNGGGGNPVVPGPTVPNPTPTPTPPGPEVFVGAGDIAICTPQNGGQDATARLMDTIGGRIFTLGDNAYPNGSRENYGTCYDKTWGRFLTRTYPTPGNHEYMTPNAAAYFDYFGDRAGPAGRGYYSFDYGAWHIISLNSNFADGVGVGVNSPQGVWLQDDLRVSQTKCTLAYWHHPLFTSGRNGQYPDMRGLFGLLYTANAEVVLTGHDHLYERFAPQDPDGRNDSARGLREFVVGTGGVVPFYNFITTRPNSDVRITNTHGVLKLTLTSDAYQWEFVTPTGVQDTGTTSCH